MITKGTLSSYPYLIHCLLSYLLLGGMDTIHHLHAATALGQTAAFHAVALGVVLIPLAITMVWLFVRKNTKIFIWVFLSIAILAILVPGFYHGGWDHMLKILAFLRLDGESTQISLLFPSDNLHLWFYEITGVFELVLAVVCAYFTYKFLTAFFSRRR